MPSLPSLGPRGEGWVAIQGVLLAALAVAATFTGGVEDGALREAGPALGAFGWLLMACGGALATAALVQLRGADSLTALPHPRAGSALVERGAYRLVRHPIYGGLCLGALGLGFVRISGPTIVVAFALIAFFLLKSRREEVWLAARYPDYPDYRGRTRALIPFLL